MGNRRIIFYGLYKGKTTSEGKIVKNERYPVQRARGNFVDSTGPITLLYEYKLANLFKFYYSHIKYNNDQILLRDVTNPVFDSTGTPYFLDFEIDY